MHLQPASWSALRLFFFRSFLLFVVIFLVSFSFGYHLLPEPGNILNDVFESMARFTARLFFPGKNITAGLISDSLLFYINALNILLLSMLLAFLWGLLFNTIRSHDRLLYWFTAGVRYYLALQLSIYGFSKIFTLQFYTPEPNTLYTKLGDVPKDLLYWSTMGVSKGYSIFLGLGEVLAATLLLFRRTALIGAFISVFILINVVAVNFAYDISVKLLSCFLLVLSVFLVLPDIKRVVQFFSGKQVAPRRAYVPQFRNVHTRWIYRILLSSIFILIFLESTWPYLAQDRSYQKKLSRGTPRGAYYVDTFILDGDTLPPLMTDTVRWKRVFFHTRGYFITEKMNDEMIDYKLSYAASDTIYVTPNGSGEVVPFGWSRPDSNTVILEGNTGLNQLKLVLRPLSLQQLPALKHEFNWTIDD
jgi:hypothetical protein